MVFISSSQTSDLPTPPSQTCTKKHLKNEWQRGEEKGEEGGKEGERKRIAEGGGRSLHGLLLT